MPFHVQMAASPVPWRHAPPKTAPPEDSAGLPLPESKADGRRLLRELRLAGPGHIPRGYDIVGRGRMTGTVFQGGVVRLLPIRASFS
jgi:hypothetical protein